MKLGKPIDAAVAWQPAADGTIVFPPVCRPSSRCSASHYESSRLIHGV